MKIHATFSESEQIFCAETNGEEQHLEADFGQIQTLTEYVGGDPYEGEYVVTPKVESQTMPTKEKVMLKDVTIKAIPYFETSNTSGGNTVYIAKEM